MIKRQLTSYTYAKNPLLKERVSTHERLPDKGFEANPFYQKNVLAKSRKFGWIIATFIRHPNQTQGMFYDRVTGMPIPDTTEWAIQTEVGV